MNRLKEFIGVFAVEEDGAQVIEYALIVAVVALTLLLALRNILGTDITGFLARLNSCLTSSTCN